MRFGLGQCILSLAAAMAAAATGLAQDCRVEPLAEPPPADELASAVVEKLASQGYRVLRGENRRVCDVWFCNEWELPEPHEASEQVLYPFAPGQLVGVLRFARRSTDFRGQQIAAGVYTLRYALQPVDGNHVGTSDSRDFLLLLPAAADTTVDALEEERLFELSKEAAGTTHPASMFLARPSNGGDVPRMEHDANREWWMLEVSNRGKRGDTVLELKLSLVVVGRASE